MSDVLWVLIALAPLVAIPTGLLLLGRRVRRRGLGHSLLGPFEEIYDPVAHRTHVEMSVHAQQEVPAPAPGDPPRP